MTDGSPDGRSGDPAPEASRTGSRDDHAWGAVPGMESDGTGRDGPDQDEADHDGVGRDGPDFDEAGTDRTEQDEVEPVEVLVGLAEAGEIDPWDIDVVRVTDKFLAVLDERDLRTSGRALFYATVLIRMKSDALFPAPEEPDQPPPDPREAVFPEGGEPAGPDPFASLESEMERRIERKRARGMPRTLDELVRELRETERESWWKDSRTYDTSDSPRGFRRGTQELDYRAGDDRRMADEPTETEVTGATHTEDVEDIVESVYAVVRDHFDAGRSEVLYREVRTAGGSRVETFLGLLFLSNRGRVSLRQDELFGDLWIQDPNAATGSEEALAD